MGDWELLQAYATQQSEAAFAELLRRHLNWVYSSARRQIGDVQLAEDVTQAVFVLLARKAGRLRPGTNLVGWLFRTTRFVAARARRTEHRRKTREEAAVDIHLIPEDRKVWAQLSPHLDEAVAALNATDRATILLRFYEQKSLREVGETLGVTEDAAKKRVSRALDRLREFMTRRGIVLGGMALAGILTEQTVQATSAALATGTLHVALAGKSVLPSLARETLNAWHLAKLKLGAGIAAIFVVGVFVTASLLSRHDSTPPPIVGSGAATAPRVADSGTTRTPPERAPVTAAQSEPATNRVMMISVVDQRTKQPLANAEIAIEQDAQKTEGRTDDDGRYEIQLPEKEPEHLLVRAHKDGFVPMRVDWYTLEGAFALPRQFTFSLEPATSIGGIIQNEQGQSIAGASVFITLRLGWSTAKPTEQLDVDVDSFKVTTDLMGRWRFDAAPASLRDLSIGIRHPDYVKEFYSDRPTRPTDEKLRDMTGVMVLRKGPSLEGLVLDENSRPVQAATVRQGGGEYASRKTTTDRDGHFRFDNCAQDYFWLTVQAEGHAPELKLVTLTPQSKPLEIRLGKASIVRGRLLDREDNPLEGFTVESENWRERRSLEWKTTTDSHGRFTWSSAPPDDVGFYIHMDGAKEYLRCVLKASENEQVVRFLPPSSDFHVRGAVVDGDNGEPISRFKVTRSAPLDEFKELLWEESLTRGFTNGTYEISFDNLDSGYAIRVKADGYLPAISETLSATQRTQVVDFKLVKGAGPQGVVRLPDGSLASGADVILVPDGRGLMLWDGKLKGYNRREAIVMTTCVDGRFSLPAESAIFTLVAIHDRGFAEMSSAALESPAEIKLQPWGRVEGTLFLGAKPQPNGEVHLSADISSRLDQRKVAVQYYNENGKTDESGHFAFERVRPGPVIIQPSYVPLEVRSGETTQITLGGTGRPIMGRIVPPTRGNSVNMSFGHTSLQTKLFGPREIIQQAIKDGTDPKAMESRLRQWESSADAEAYRLARRVYWVAVRPDGSFRVDDVPAGTYMLHVYVTEPHDRNDSRSLNSVKPIGALDQEVVVTEMPGGRSDEPLDLGDLELKPVSPH